ncbi:hypothetical protein BY996DRAFT_7192296 [Phakopsora pachyrhizi]|nr:hypothetical protein BY996DRAFT_7192296 [Phakopsora pachyrhizi]
MVPQLFFDAFKPDGVSLTLEELLNSNIFIQSNFQQHPKSINSLLDNYPFSTLPINPSTSPLQTPKHQQDDSSDFLNFRFLSRVDNPMIENRDAWVSRSCWSIHPCNTHKALEDILSAEDCRKILPVDLIESYFVLISTLIDLRSHQ